MKIYFRFGVLFKLFCTMYPPLKIEIGKANPMQMMLEMQRMSNHLLILINAEWIPKHGSNSTAKKTLQRAIEVKKL